jgi:hypothetical protein
VEARRPVQLLPSRQAVQGAGSLGGHSGGSTPVGFWRDVDAGSAALCVRGYKARGSMVPPQAQDDMQNNGCAQLGV